MLALAQKTGVINVAFSAAGLVKDMISKVLGMSIQTGVVNVNGATVPGSAPGSTRQQQGGDRAEGSRRRVHHRGRRDRPLRGAGHQHRFERQGLLQEQPDRRRGRQRAAVPGRDMYAQRRKQLEDEAAAARAAPGR